MSDLFYKEGIRFECQGSGKCCTSRGSYGYVYLTLKDRRRLAEHHKMRTSEFTKRYCDKTSGYFHLKSPEKDCVYLRQNKCIAYEARPNQCRTWPFWPENLTPRTWNEEIKSFCPGVGKGKLYSPKEIEKILQSDREES